MGNFTRHLDGKDNRQSLSLKKRVSRIENAIKAQIFDFRRAPLENRIQIAFKNIQTMINSKVVRVKAPKKRRALSLETETESSEEEVEGLMR
jgi:hypothetical protein